MYPCHSANSHSSECRPADSVSANSYSVECHFDECHNADCHFLCLFLIVTLDSVVLLFVSPLSFYYAILFLIVILLSVNRLRVVLIIVLALIASKPHNETAQLKPDV